MNQLLQNNKKVLSLFSGCGGMDLGFEGGFSVPKRSVLTPEWISSTSKDFIHLKRTSFQTVFANDIRPGAKAAWISYFGKRSQLGVESTYHLESIIDLVKREKAGENIFPKNIDIVTGGFPCQDFSVAGKRKGFHSHKSHSGGQLAQLAEPTIENRGMLYYWMKEVINIVQPKVFIAENVKGLVSLPNVKKIIEQDFASIGDGYLIAPVRILNAANFGVPQNRERVIFIGFQKSSISEETAHLIKQGDALVSPYPTETHSLPSKVSTKLEPFVSVKEALMHLTEPEQASDLSQRAYSKAKWYGKHCQGQKEVDLNSISPTIRSEHHGNIEFRRLSEDHGGKNLSELKLGLSERRLTVRECARIQTFPDDYQFVIPNIHNKRLPSVSGSEAYKLIGNAVPPLLAYHLAMRLELIWENIFSSSYNDFNEKPVAVSY